MSKQVHLRYKKEIILAGLLHLINNPDKYRKYKDFIKADNLFLNDTSDESKAIRELFKLTKEITKENDYSKLNLDNLRAQIHIKIIVKERAELLSEYFLKWMENPEILSLVNSSDNFEVFLDYIKLIQFAASWSVFHDKYNSGDVLGASEIMSETINKIKQISGSDNVRDLNGEQVLKMLEDQKNRDINIGIPLMIASGSGKNPLDDILGGFEPQTFNLILGETGGGKSMFGHHLIEQCILQKKHVFVVCLEDREKSFAFKYVSNMSKIPLKRLRRGEFTSEEIEKISKILIDFDKYVKVKFINGMGIDSVHKICQDYDDECSRLGKPKPEVNIVDYTGHIISKSGGKNDKSYERFREAYGARKDYALSSGKICFDFAQVNREGAKSISSDKPLSHYDLAGAYDLAQVCDSILSVNRSDLDKLRSTARIYISKARDSISGICVKVATDFDCASFDMDQWAWWGEVPENLKAQCGQETLINTHRL